MNTLLSSIQQAAAYGYTADQILRFLGGRFKGLKKPIKEAQDLGHDAENILGFLTNQPKFAGSNEFERVQRGQGYTRRGERLKEGIQAAAKAIPAIAGAATVRSFFTGQRVKPSPGPQAPTSPIGTPGIQIPQAAGQIAQPTTPTKPTPQPAPPAGQGTPQTPGPLTPPNAPRTPNPKHVGIIDQMQNAKGIIESLASKESPQVIADMLDQQILSPGQKKWLSEQTKEPLVNVVEDYLAQKPQQAPVEAKQELPPEAIQPSPTTDLVPEPTKLVEEKPAETNLVLTPSGDIGTLSKEEKGIASVDVEGKQKNFRDEDVIKPPIPEKDIADIYEELIQAIPESERSAVINVAGYDPNHNELIFMPHTGALYVYKDIPPEFAEKLQGAMFKAKTTGENLYGAWSEGESSRFAGLSKLIRELQQLYGGKGKEYIRKYEKIYDFLAIPKAAHKEKEKKKREEERARQGKKPRKPKSS